MTMLNTSRFARLNTLSNKLWQRVGLFVVSAVALCTIATPALAHHPMGGRIPTNFLEGFISGIAHPLIAPDHFAFIVSVGLLAATRTQGMVIPVAFVLAAMLGTGVHLLNLTIPGVELVISGSILVVGGLLVEKDRLNIAVIAGLSAISGLFHGYAYGEAIVGAGMPPLLAYLIGFTVIQLLISLSVFWIARTTILRHDNELQPQPRFRSAGLVICGIGLAFFTSQVMDTIVSIFNT